MMKRLENEKPEFFEESTISRAEIVAHLTHNMCLPYAKIKSRVMRETTSKIKEKEHLTE
jgi:hypothetical protein